MRPRFIDSFLWTPVAANTIVAEMDQIAKVHSEFEKQANSFNDSSHTIGSHEIMEWIIGVIQPSHTQCALDVAAGTALLGRALAKIAKAVVAVDATNAMLEVGRRAAAEDGLHRIEFLNAEVENLPFPDEKFDLVVSRLAVHHFLKPELAASEMCRVCKVTGKVFVIDLLSPDEPAFQKIYNDLERMRDPSHALALTREQFFQIFGRIGQTPTLRDIKAVEVDFEKWVQLTKTPDDVVRSIQKTLLTEISGGEKTGFQPKLIGSKLKFYQRWAIFEA